MNEIKVSFNESESKYISIFKAFKCAIEDDVLKKDDRLPSKRKLSSILGVSLNTILFAYQRLEDEEYIYSKEKQGYFVTGYRTYHKNDTSLTSDTEKTYMYDFTSGNIDSSLFPSFTIRKIINDITLNDSKVFIRKTPKKGDVSLRKAISNYLYENKGMDVDFRNCIIVSSFEESLEILSRIMRINIVGIEDPGYPKVKEFFQDKEIKKFNVDEDGIILDKKYPLDLLYVTPYNQFPYGCKMSRDRRKEVLEYPVKYIFEDDFDCDLIRNSKRITTLYALNPNRVIYHGSFNHTICPGLRIGYLIIPDDLRNIYDDALNKGSSRVSTLDQMILYSFLKDGYYYRNINKIKKSLDKKMNLACDILKNEFGLNEIKERTYSFIINIDDKTYERIKSNIKKHNLKMDFLNDYTSFKMSEKTIILSILSIPYEEIKKAIELLFL